MLHLLYKMSLTFYNKIFASPLSYPFLIISPMVIPYLIINNNSIYYILKLCINTTTDHEIYQIQEYRNDNLQYQDRWLVFRLICNVPNDVKEDSMTKE